MVQVDELFYNYPSRLFHIREISRLTSIPKTTVANRVANLIKYGLVLETKDVFTAYRANDSSLNYQNKKKLFALNSIFESGLIQFIEEQLYPDAIILFGSFAKGEFDISSDIDLFIQSSSAKLNLSNFEKKFNRKIQLFIYESLVDVSPNLANNIVNGVKLSGHIDLF